MFPRMISGKFFLVITNEDGSESCFWSATVDGVIVTELIRSREVQFTVTIPVGSVCYVRDFDSAGISADLSRYRSDPYGGGQLSLPAPSYDPVKDQD